MTDTVAGPPVPTTTLDSQSLLRELVADGRLNLTLGALFEQPAPCSPGQVHWDRVRGMMLGLAIGDALGNTTESLLPGPRRQLARRDSRLPSTPVRRRSSGRTPIGR